MPLKTQQPPRRYAHRLLPNSDKYKITIQNSLSDLSTDPVIKYSSITAAGVNHVHHHKNILTLTPSQLNLYKHASTNPTRYPRLEETYVRYITGILNKGSLVMNRPLVNRMLKQKKSDFVVKQAPTSSKRSLASSMASLSSKTTDEPPQEMKVLGAQKMQIVSKAKIIGDRVKAVQALNEKWEKMEEFRTMILIQMKTLRGYNEYRAVLRKQNVKIKEEYDRVSAKRNGETREILKSIQYLEDKMSNLRVEHENKKDEPKIELAKLRRHWKIKILKMEAELSKLREELDKCDNKLKELEPFQNSTFSASYNVKLRELDKIRASNKHQILAFRQDCDQEIKDLIETSSNMAQELSVRTNKMFTHEDLANLYRIKNTEERLKLDFHGQLRAQELLDHEIELLEYQIAEIQIEDESYD